MLDAKTQRELQRRRQRFMAAIGPEAVAVISSGSEKTRNSDVHYLFRPNSDFVYLTGFNEPDATLVLAPGHTDGEATLFVRPRDIHAEQWNGRRLGSERVPEALCIKRAFDTTQLKDHIGPLLNEREALHCDQSDVQSSIQAWLDWAREARLKPPETILPLTDTLHELRLYKSDAELELMQTAANISASAHKRAMRRCKPGMSEMDLENELQYEFTRLGARYTAYPSIVASGENACIMHYIENNRTIEDEDLVLIDAGCELGCYASDITRTFPANGRYSSVQRDVYEIVLAAQKEAIDQARIGNGFTSPHNAANRVLTQGLIDLGVLKGSLEENIEQDNAAPFTVHRCSHFLGMDVHDVGKRTLHSADRPLEAGMALTVEPGLYFGEFESMPPVEARFRGIGIRIEDDVVVTDERENGKVNHVLTTDVPKSASEIEELMSG